MERGTEKKRTFADMITPEEYALLRTDEVHEAIARAADATRWRWRRTAACPTPVWSPRRSNTSRGPNGNSPRTPAQCILPPRAFEQASSEACAAHKRIAGDSVLDLTCGLGADARSS